VQVGEVLLRCHRPGETVVIASCRVVVPRLPWSMRLRGYPWGPRTARMEPEDYPRAFRCRYRGDWMQVDIIIIITVDIKY